MQILELVFLVVTLSVAIGPHAAVGAGVIALLAIALVALVVVLLGQLLVVAGRNDNGRVLVGRINLLALLFGHRAVIFE